VTRASLGAQGALTRARSPFAIKAQAAATV
jgi:hypothetical protein